MCKDNLRTYGIELEGYTYENIRGNHVKDWKLIDDGSLTSGENECDECYNGECSCGECNGNGNNECYECDGYGDTECGDCAGCGEIPCDECDCTGKVTNDEGKEVECSKCEGSCYIECETCEGNGRYDCDNCEGRGNVDCEECNGSGEVTCSSCGGSGSSGDGEFGVECVSGILNEGDYEPIGRIFNYIDRYSWFTNSDCGTHVHIGGQDLQAIDLSKLAILMNIVEPFIYGISPSDRIDGTYAKKTNREMIENYIAIGNQIDLQQISNKYYGFSRNINHSFSKYEHARYFGLNLHSWFYRKTIEFRYFQGCESEERAIAYIDLCIKLVDFAKYTSLEQLTVIGKTLFEVDDLGEYISKVKELLGLEYLFTAYSDYAFRVSKRNIASQLRTTHVIERTA